MPLCARKKQAYQQGNVMIGPMGGAPGEYRLVISNYLKQGDSMTLVMNKAQKALVSLSISTYLSDPSDAVKVNVQFSRLPGGRRGEQEANDYRAEHQLLAHVEGRGVRGHARFSNATSRMRG
jgi:hypothetical protein